MILTTRDFEERIERTQKLLAEESIDAVLAFSTESEPAQVRYYADYWPSFETAAVLIPKEGKPVLVIGPESLTYASSRSKIEKIVQIMDLRESSQPDYPNSKLPTWSDLLSEYKIKNLGISGWFMFPYTMMQNVAAALGGIEHLSNADAIVRKVMIRKTAAEANCLRQAAKISEFGLKAILESIKPGMTEVELCGIATEAMLVNGAEATGYPIWCCSGPNSNQAISRPSLRKIQEGEIVHFSIGAKVEGYSASIGRPIVLGHCDPDLRRFLQVGLDASNMTFDRMRAGLNSGAVAKEIHQFVIDKGYGHSLLYGPAHGCGQMECEYPFLETSSTYMLEKDMTFMADMFMAEKGYGARWEDGLIIREEGPAEQLSSYKRELLIL